MTTPSCASFAMGANDKVIKAVSVMLDGDIATLTTYDENLRVIGRQEAPLAYQELSKKPPCICLPGLLGTAPACPVHGAAFAFTHNVDPDGDYASPEDSVYDEPNQTLRKQEYETVGYLTMDPNGTGWISHTSTTEVKACGGCGALVGDTDQHDLFHSKTRSIV